MLLVDAGEDGDGLFGLEIDGTHFGRGFIAGICAFPGKHGALVAVFLGLAQSPRQRMVAVAQLQFGHFWEHMEEEGLDEDLRIPKDVPPVTFAA